MANTEDVVIDELMIDAEELTLGEQFNDGQVINCDQFHHKQSCNNENIVNHRRMNDAPTIVGKIILSLILMRFEIFYLEQNVRGEIVTINRLKHYFFIKRYILFIRSLVFLYLIERTALDIEIFLEEISQSLVMHNNPNV